MIEGNDMNKIALLVMVVVLVAAAVIVLNYSQPYNQPAAVKKPNVSLDTVYSEIQDISDSLAKIKSALAPSPTN